ncbi:MAG: hypothetical protein C0501_18145 [Isosphaera sp.]|nr:hypothetical protein [Isosphaera sp.]
MRNRLKIVLADDDGAARDRLSGWLAQLGHEVTAVAGGRALVGAFADSDPDLVISDAGMPDLDGVTAATAVRRRAPVPVILLSGEWEPDQLERAAAAGVGWCLAKPPTPLELVAAVEAARPAARGGPDARRAAFLVTLAHELRNQLAPLASYAGVLQLPGHEAAVRDLGAKIDACLRRMAGLLDQAYDADQVCRGTARLARRRVDARDAVARAAETARPTLDAGRHELVVRVPPAPLWLHADPDRLEQVLVNLLTNAAKYTPDGGRVEVAAEADGGEVVLTVRDNGVGVPPGQAEAIFELFAQLPDTLSRSKGGLGVGLAVVRELVALHGGTVRCHSDGPGTGSAFVVRLPAG